MVLLFLFFYKSLKCLEFYDLAFWFDECRGEYQQPSAISLTTVQVSLARGQTFKNTFMCHLKKSLFPMALQNETSSTEKRGEQGKILFSELPIFFRQP